MDIRTIKKPVFAVTILSTVILAACMSPTMTYKKPLKISQPTLKKKIGKSALTLEMSHWQK